MDERTIVASIHGRYLVAGPAGDGSRPLLIGFHGYGETAEAQLERMRQIPGVDGWLLVSAQGLHTFYRGRSEEVVAGWMTRQQRDLAITDNIAYVSSVVDVVAGEYQTRPALVFAGFSQGVAMAFRAAAASTRPVSGVIALGGDVPPEISTAALAGVGAVLLGRGARDDWYTAEKFTYDIQRLEKAGVNLATVEVDAGHEWTAAFASRASSFLEGFSP